jgi:hypothetical protein
MAKTLSCIVRRSNVMMKFSILSAIALGLTALCASPSQAGQAQEYAWCSPRDGGENMDCMYSTYQQCVATSSGLGGGGCTQNPEFNLSRPSEAKAKY